MIKVPINGEEIKHSVKTIKKEEILDEAKRLLRDGKISSDQFADMVEIKKYEFPEDTHRKILNNLPPKMATAVLYEELDYLNPYDERMGVKVYTIPVATYKRIRNNLPPKIFKEVLREGAEYYEKLLSRLNEELAEEESKLRLINAADAIPKQEKGTLPSTRRSLRSPSEIELVKAELKRLNNLIEDLKDEVEHLSRRSFKNKTIEETKVMQGILK